MIHWNFKIKKLKKILTFFKIKILSSKILMKILKVILITINIH